jgi:hypothetical protein
VGRGSLFSPSFKWTLLGATTGTNPHFFVIIELKEAPLFGKKPK